MRIPSDQAKKRLAIVWFVGGGVLFLLVVVQSLLGHYGKLTEDFLAWFLPTIIPTLTLILGVLVSDALGQSETGGSVDSFIYRLALALSIFYLITISLIILVQPWTDPFLDNLDRLIKNSNRWIIPLQGLVSAALGAFYVSKR